MQLGQGLEDICNRALSAWRRRGWDANRDRGTYNWSSIGNEKRYA